MARTRGSMGACNGLSNKEVIALVHKQYADFCQYRWELSNRMSDRRIGLFDNRVFTDGHFELGG